jgi:hypothetical protein
VVVDVDGFEKRCQKNKKLLLFLAFLPVKILAEMIGVISVVHLGIILAAMNFLCGSDRFHYSVGCAVLPSGVTVVEVQHVIFVPLDGMSEGGE